MNWLDLLNQVFQVCLIPLLGFATTALIYILKQKMNDAKEKTGSEIAGKYLDMLEATIVDCIKATNQTYVNALKDKNAFDADAQKEALRMTTDAVMKILSDDAKDYLKHFVGDLDEIVREKIEANINQVKQ